MKCCQCQGIESIFSEKWAERELVDYHKKGPGKTTRILLEALQQAGVSRKTLLDIGGGVGAIQHRLAQAGATKITNVDASTGYLGVAKLEATQLGYADQASYHHGDFVELAPDLAASDIVTLDRVLCCYPDVERLVSLSAAKARQLYGLVYPRDTWWLRLGRPIFNLMFWLLRNPYRFFVHTSETVDAEVRRQGLQQRFYRQTFFWQVVVYERRT
jgi:magnesium-protoporphyrin O-methyltransferase